MWGCAIAGGTDKVWESPTYTPTSMGAGTSASGLEKSLNDASSTSSGATSPSTSAAAAKGSSSAPTGAIIGGVVGGVAVVALFVLGLVFILRRRRRGGPSDAQGAVPAYQAGAQPNMQQRQQYDQASLQPPVDPATGYAAVPPVKPGYKYDAANNNNHNSMYGSTLGTPPGSPPPMSPGPVSVMSGYLVSNASAYALNSQGDPAYGGAGVMGTQAHAGNIFHEMPADRELRELP